MNRPFGAVDVAASLKGTIAKATTQKILVALSDVLGWASSPEPAEPSPFKPKPGLTQMRA